MTQIAYSPLLARTNTIFEPSGDQLAVPASMLVLCVS
jgi:hypothetical protein